MIIVGYAFLIGMLLFILDRYLDMRVVSYTADAQRHANNLLHLVLNSKLITKEKLIIDKNELDKYDENNWFSYPMNSYRKDWESSNEIIEYDYNFSVIEFGAKKHEFGNLIFNMNNPCYFDYQRIKGYTEMPVSVYHVNDEYRPGIANLTLMKTPLTELCFWISQSSLRLEEKYDDEILKSIRVGPEVTSIVFDNAGYICMYVNGKWVCKSFYHESYQIRICETDESIPKDYIGKSCEILPDISNEPILLKSGCKAISINATKNSIDIIIPEST
jgi:hypothetical protein